jgi:hypothetical protein
MGGSPVKGYFPFPSLHPRLLNLECEVKVLKVWGGAYKL